MIKITERQALFLFHLLQDTLTKNVVGYLSTSHEDRGKILNEILNQQSGEFLKLEGE